MTVWAPLKRFCSEPPQYGLNVAAADYQADGARLIRTSDIGPDGRLGASDKAVFVDPGIVAAEHRLRVDDLLFSRSGTLGRCLRIADDPGEATFAGFLVRFRPRADVDSRFVAYCADAGFFQAAIAADAVTSTISNFRPLAVLIAGLAGQYHQVLRLRSLRTSAAGRTVGSSTPSLRRRRR